MINILKPLEAWATRLKNNEFQWATLKLTFYYVLSTAVILVVSSAAVLVIFAPPETEVPFRPETVQKVAIEHSDWSVYEVREHLEVVIFIVDVCILWMISVLSYFFARKTLSPIQIMHENQRQFLGDVAHELRTPLSVLQAGADSTLRKERSSQEYQSFVVDVQSEARRLTRLTDQFLQLLRTGDNTTENDFTRENISRIVENQIRQFTSYATEHTVRIQSNISDDVYGVTSRDHLMEVLQNLLKNAIDYNIQNGSVAISLTDLETTVVIEVSDTGVGIPAQKLDTVFGRFVKSDHARTHTTTNGAGLGLAIVRELVNKLGGTSALSSTIGAGTTVTLTLPKNHS